MLTKLIRLFRRYCDHHFAIELPGFALTDMDGDRFGQVERICFGRTTLRVEGWSIADQVGLGQPARIKLQKPDILRADVIASLDLGPERCTGFNLAWFGQASSVMLALSTANATLQVMCPQPSRWRRLRAELSIRLSFVKALVRASGPLMRVVIVPSAQNTARAKRALGLEPDQTSFALSEDMFKHAQDAERRSPPPRGVTLIMPVFNAFEVLKQALDRIARHTDVPWRLILVEDCSTDDRVRPFLRLWSQQQRDAGQEIILIEQSTNQGFIGSVNLGFKAALRYDHPVVLINSDALVPPDWASRIVYPIQRDPRVASVTPMSNDAEIFNAPQICHRSDIGPSAALAVDRALRDQIRIDASKAAPTGVGFCMAINLRYLRSVPQLDPVFGKGYGEEVDWCRKVAKLGGRHVGQPALFVEHRGGASFGDAAKRAAIAKNNQIISKRYPSYDQAVQRFIGEDPLRSARLLAAIARISAEQDRVSIYIAHALGGGAELYLQEKLRAHCDSGQGAIVLRVGGRMRWRLEAHSPQGSVVGDTHSTAIVHRLLRPVRCRDVIYSCAVGDSDPASLPSEISRILGSRGSTLTVLVHDYFVVSPSYCLLDDDGVFRGTPPIDSAERVHGATLPNGARMPHRRWRESWGALLRAADTITCFSQSSAEIMQSAYPFVQGKCLIEPHSVSPIARVRPLSTKSGNVIGVLGDIGIQKGAALVQKLASRLPEREFEKLVVVGRLDPRFEAGARCVETGAYMRSDVAKLAEKHGITCWLIPSIWPETFSYTTHEALATGLPVFGFDLGAQGEAVAREPNGHVMPFAWREDAGRILTQIEGVLLHGAKHRSENIRTETGRNRGFAA